MNKEEGVSISGLENRHPGWFQQVASPAHHGLLPPSVGLDYGFRGGWTGSIFHAANSHQWDSPRGKCPLLADVLCKAEHVAATSIHPPVLGPARRKLYREPESASYSLRAPGEPAPPAARRQPPPRGGRDAAGGRRGARGGEGVLARLGEVSGVVTETRQYGGDRPRPLAEEPPNTR